MAQLFYDVASVWRNEFCQRLYTGSEKGAPEAGRQLVVKRPQDRFWRSLCRCHRKPSIPGRIGPRNAACHESKFDQSHANIGDTLTETSYTSLHNVAPQLLEWYSLTSLY